MDLITRILSTFAPGLAARRLLARAQLANAQRLYQAASTSRYRPRRGSGASGDAVMDHARGHLREFARYLDENLDLAVAVLDDLVNNIVGGGIQVRPMARLGDGAPAARFNRDARDLWREWWRRPEVSGELPGPELERLICRTWLRDGELFVHQVTGAIYQDYPTAIPYLLEPLEADFVPFDLFQPADTITHGIAKNAWGKPQAYFVYKQHPGSNRARLNLQTKRVPAEEMLHLKFVRRLHQTRGVSVFHAVLERLDDIKDYEESERIAARIAASMVAYIKRGEGFGGQVLGDDAQREFAIDQGMVWDNLLPGEDVGTIDAKRPNSALADFRAAMLRAAAGGTGTRYSAIARDYNGTYSAQRQELVEGRIGYLRLRSYLVGAFYRPVRERFLRTAIEQGLLRLEPGIDRTTLFDAEYRGPAIPWIDPKKEVEGYALAVAGGFKSRHQVILDLGGDPEAVDAQLAADAFAQPANIPGTGADNTGNNQTQVAA